MVCAGRIEITLYDIELAIDLRQSTRRLEIDVVRKPIVWIVHKVELDGIPLPNTNKFAGHPAAKRPERVCDTLGYRKDDLLNVQLHDHLGRLTSWEWWWAPGRPSRRS
jgi:hypothetical protein